MALIVVLHGELDYCNTATTAARLYEAVKRSRMVIIRLDRLEFLDCAGLGAIAAARTLARANGGDLILQGPEGIVRRLLVALDFPFRE